MHVHMGSRVFKIPRFGRQFTHVRTWFIVQFSVLRRRAVNDTGCKRGVLFETKDTIRLFVPWRGNSYVYFC
jgi:hypothetical protein